MPHPYQSLLDEYQFAINHLVPTVSPEIKTKAQKWHDQFMADQNVEEIEIKKALFQTGRAEYPHRHAYKEMSSVPVEARTKEMVLDHVDDEVEQILNKYFGSGVSLEEIIESRIFETDFSAEQRYQIEDAILDAKDHLKEEMADSIDSQSELYQKAYTKWNNQAQKIEVIIEELEALKDQDPKWTDEIINKVIQFREGFLLTEIDPDLEEIKNEIEYWKGVFKEEI
ncbi:hypothetical protein ACFLZY_00975 [Patescibacteria group bacterium]